MNRITDPDTLLAAISLVFLVAALSWLALAKLERLSPLASRLLALANLLLGVGLALHGSRGVLPDLLTYLVSDVLAIGGMACLRAAVPVIGGDRPAWRSALAVTLPAAALLAAMPYGQDLHVHSMVAFGADTLLGAMACRDAWRQLSRELKPRLAMLLLLPWIAVPAFTGIRVLRAWWEPALDTDLTAHSDFGVDWLWSGLLMCVLLNALVAMLLLLRLVLQIQHLTRFDPLTELLNRRALRELLEREHDRLLRGPSYSVLLVDLDHFKRLNDTLGHAAGDAALRRIAATLRCDVRELDRPARLGGEEFCVLLPRTPMAEAWQVAERLRERIEALDFMWEGRPWPLSASIGVAQAERRDGSPAAVLGRADRAMYQAKHAGRNQVALADDLPGVSPADGAQDASLSSG